MESVNHRLEPDDYSELSSLKCDKGVLVFEKDRNQGLVELKFNWDDMNYHLSLSEEYSDSAHLDALDYIEENYEESDLPEDIGFEDVRSISSAGSSEKVNIKWEDEIVPRHPASGLNY